MKNVITVIILVGVLVLFMNCEVQQKVKPVKSYSFTLSVPIQKHSLGKSKTEQENVNFTVKIMDEKNDIFSGLLKITSSKNSKWRYIRGRYITQDSLVFTDSLAILDVYYNVPAPKSTRLTNATYSLKLDNETIKGKMSVVPAKLDTVFDKYLPPANSSFEGIFSETDTLSEIEMDAWSLFATEQSLKAQFDSIQNRYQTFPFEYDKLLDSVYYSMSDLALGLLKTGYPFFEKYQHGPDSSVVQKDFYYRIGNCLRFCQKNEKDLTAMREYLTTIQPEGSRYYLTWNWQAHDCENRFAWTKFKMQKDPEFSGQRSTKEEVASKNISRRQEFLLSVDPARIHPLEKLNYFYDFSYRVVQHNIGYKDYLLNMADEAEKMNSQDEEYLYHINRLKDTVEKYVNLNKRLDNPAPNFTATDIKGKTINLASLKGKVVYLDFWTTWCSPCRGSIPQLKSLYEKYKKSGFEIIGIAPDKLEDVLKMCQDEKMSWPQIVPTKNNAPDLLKTYGVASFPKGFLIDKKGIIAEIMHPNDDRFDFILQQYLLE